MKYSYVSYPIVSIMLILCSSFSWGQAVRSVDSGMITQWDNPVTVVPATLRANDVDFPAHTITVHGTNANRLFREWRSEVREKTRDLSGRRPTTARNVPIPEISSSPVTVMAEATGSRREPFARLTVAFAQNDTTPLTDTDLQQRYMRDMAVRYNQVLIEEEIADRKRDLQRVQRRADRADSDEQRTRKRLDRAENRLQRTQDRRVKADVAKAELEGEVMGLERAARASQAERDQRRLIRARRSLNKKESDVLKYMEREMGFQQDVNENKAKLPEHDQTQRDKNEQMKELEREINALETARENL